MFFKNLTNWRLTSAASVCLVGALVSALAPPAWARDRMTFRVQTAEGVLNVREGPGVGYRVKGYVPSGDTVTIVCTAFDDHGQVWDRISTRTDRPRYVLDRYVKTGSSRPAAQACEGVEQARPGPTIGPLRTPKGDLYRTILQFMTSEMRQNGNEALRKNLSCRKYFPAGDVACLLVFWRNKVAAKHQWDHKPVLRDRYFQETVRSSERYTQVPGSDFAVNFDVWSNIHYGYVGTLLGLSSIALQTAANGFPGSGLNDDGDRLTIDIGIQLAHKIAPGDLSQEAIDSAVREKLSDLMSLHTGAAISAQECKTVAPVGALPHCEGPWDMTRLYPNETLKPRGEHALLRREVSNGSTVELVMQDDGNLVLYNRGGVEHGGRVCWASNTVGRGSFATYQEDGNFVVYEADGRTAAWASKTDGDGVGLVSIDDWGTVYVGKNRNWKLNEYCM
jgi:hypothetical protein